MKFFPTPEQLQEIVKAILMIYGGMRLIDLTYSWTKRRNANKSKDNI